MIAYPFAVWVRGAQLLRWLLRGGRGEDGVQPDRGGAKEQAASPHSPPHPPKPPKPRRKVKRVFLELP